MKRHAEPASEFGAVLLPTTVVGSYSVPEWLERLKTEYYQRRISAQHLAEIHEVAIKAAVKDQELAGIDIVSDGELRRDNDVDYFLARIAGVQIPQRAKTDYFDYYEAEVTRPLPEQPGGAGLGLADDFRFTRQLTGKPVKFSFTGPFSLSRRIRDEAYAEPGDLVRALARRLNGEARELAEAGADLLQIDEPFLAGYSEQVELAVEAVNIVTDGVPATWALHVCYGNRYARQSWEGHYDFLFPAVKAARAVLDFAAIARKVICDIGYDTGDFGFDGNAVGVITALDRQSPDIARGVTESHDARAGSTDPFDSVGAGDQGMMFGYASNETPELMPMPIVLAHKLARRLAEVRRNGLLPYLRPDGKTQVTVRYEEGKPVGVEKVLISTPHEDGVEPKLADALWEQVVTQVLPPGLYDAGALRKEFYVNPTGRFVIGGPVGDTGLTGRKIIVDTYGGFARHGGGAFSGKDPSKVDRSASYAARHVAKNIVAAGLAARAEVQVAYAIGVARRSPCSSRPSALRRSAGPPSPTWCETISTCGPPPW